MKLIAHFRVITFLFFVLGAWRLKIKNPILRYGYTAYFKIYQSFVYLLVTSQGIQGCILMKQQNFEELMSCINAILPYFFATLKLNLFRSKPIQDLLKDISVQEDIILKSSNEVVKKIYTEYSKRANRSYVLSSLMCYQCFVLYCGYPKVPVYPNIDSEGYQNATPKYVPLPVYVWFDKYENIVLANILVSGFCFMAVTLYACTNAIYYGFLIYGAGQIKILQHFLENVYEYARGIEKRDGLCSEEAQLRFTKSCIAMHQHIIRYVAIVDENIRNFMLLSFMLSSLNLACIFILIVQQSAVADTFNLVSYFGLELINLHYNYWYANEILTESSEGISVAVFKGKWYLCSEHVKKDLLFIIIRSRKPCKIGIGPFYDMDLKAVVNILRACYSYICLIVQHQDVTESN